MDKLTVEEVGKIVGCDLIFLGAPKVYELAKQLADTLRENTELKECLNIALHAAKKGNKIYKKSAFVTIAESLLQSNKDSDNA